MMATAATDRPGIYPQPEMPNAAPTTCKRVSYAIR